MKDSPRLLLIPIVLVVGVVGYWYVTNEILQNQPDAGFQVGVATSTESNATTSDTIAEIRVRSGTSSRETLSPEELEARQRELEKTRWRKSNIVMEEPCDFAEMKNFADALLSKPEWVEILNRYPNRTYTTASNKPSNILVANRLLHSCYLEVTLSSPELSQTEFEEWAMKSAFANALTLINPTLTYQGAAVNFEIGTIPIAFLLADGPSGSSFGTYQYEAQSASVRLFTVHSGFRPTHSPYEADASGKEMCPCVEHINLLITNPVSAEDIGQALEKPVFLESYKPER